MENENSNFPSFLKIAVVPAKHLFEIKLKDGKVRYEGIEAEFLKTLSQILNFGYEILIPEDKTWGIKDSNGKWKGVIGMVHRGEADIGLSHLDIIEARTEAVDFSVPYDVSDKTFATEYPNPYPRYAVFTYPFSISVWFYIFCAFLFTCIGLRILSSKERLDITFIFKMFGTLCKQPFEIKEMSWKWKILFMIWCLFVTVITLSYSAVLFAYLTIPLREEGVTTIAELSSAVEKGFYKCRIANGTYDLHLLLGSKQRDLNIIGQRALINNWFYDPLDESLHKFIQPYTAVMANRIAFSTPAFHDLYVSDDSFGVWYIGIATGKSFCCKRKLNIAILRILSSGIFQRFQKDELSKVISHSLHIHGNQQNFLHLNEVFGVFIPLGIGLGLSLIVFVGEIFYFYVTRKKEIIAS